MTLTGTRRRRMIATVMGRKRGLGKKMIVMMRRRRRKRKRVEKTNARAAKDESSVKEMLGQWAKFPLLLL